MKTIIILCEISGTVRDAFRKRGHDAYSVDILPSSNPYHLQCSITEDTWNRADLVIAHPPCTWICVSGNRHYAGTVWREISANFIQWIWNLKHDQLCIENPVGQINTYLPSMPKPQYIQPWMFGHGETKKTGLWKRGLPDLVPTKVVQGREQRIWKMPPNSSRSADRSITYQGIADAMAEQWG